MSKLYGLLQQNVPVYFGVNGHRYQMTAYYFDEFERGPDPFAPPNCFELKDEDTGMLMLFTGKSAEKELSEYPLAGGATIKNDMDKFVYLRIGDDGGM
jgi:hypothetical protein